jgi:hypothetical protein
MSNLRLPGNLVKIQVVDIVTEKNGRQKTSMCEVKELEWWRGHFSKYEEPKGNRIVSVSQPRETEAFV